MDERIYQGFGPELEIEEADGEPDVRCVRTLVANRHACICRILGT